MCKAAVKSPCYRQDALSVAQTVVSGSTKTTAFEVFEYLLYSYSLAVWIIKADNVQAIRAVVVYKLIIMSVFLDFFK